MKKRIGKKFKNNINKKSNSHLDSAVKFLRLPESKRSQEVMGMSFGVIFSIILIVFFILIAGIVIRSFLKTGDCAKIGIFIDDLESDVRKSWNAQSDSHIFKANLPSGIEHVCFANLSNSNTGEFVDIGQDISLFEGRKANTFLYPTGKTCEIPYFFINHLDIEKITKTKNPNCVEVQKGRIEINIEKGFNDRFVNVEI